jgi:ABC-type nitrate/sulfonate/bicarbonate transport system permease component
MILWEVITRAGLIDSFLLPPLSDIFARAWENLLDGSLILNATFTVIRSFISFVLASALGVLIGVGMARSRMVYWLFDPIVSIGFPMPKISFLPIFILWFGLYDLPKVLLATLACIFPIITASYLGTSGVDKLILWSAWNMGMSEQKIFFRVVMPAALPQILNGMQVAFPISLIVVIVTEMLMSGDGLGSFMILAARFGDSTAVFVGIATIALLGYFLMRLFAVFRARVLVWHPETEIK